MTTNSPTFKQKVISNAENAVAGNPPVSCGPGCQPCRRVDLQLLVLTPSVVPAEYAKALAGAGYAWAPAFDPAYSGIKRGATLPVARIARKGYFMVFYPDRIRWDVWQIMEFGLTRKIMHQVSAKQYAEKQAGFANAPAPKTCSRKAANLTAQLISIEGAVAINKVWIAFTDHLWTPATLARYAANPDVEIAGSASKAATTKKLRDVRGREISPKAMLDGELPANALPLTTASLQSSVADFVMVAERNFKKAFARALKPLDSERIGKAAECDKQVRAIEKVSGPSTNPALYLNKSAVLMVPDPIGVADQYNELRSAVLAEQQAWAAGGVDSTGENADPKRPWQRQSLLHAVYIRERIKKKELDWQINLANNGAVRHKQVISGDEYRKINALDSRGGKPYYPAGTTYERLPGNVERYSVSWADETILRGLTSVAKSNAAGKIERYNKHLNWTAVDAFNKIWLTQEKNWLILMAARDTDYVAWMVSDEFKVSMQHDFDDVAALRRGIKTKTELMAGVLDAAARIEATARCYGSGALSDASLKYLFAEFGKDEGDHSHFVAEALFKPFSVLGKLKEDAGSQADAYDAFTSFKDSWTEFRDAWKEVREPTASAATILLQTAHQVTDRMEQVARLPSVAANTGLKMALNDAMRKKVIWIRAAGLHHYLATGSRQYFISVKWNVGAFAAAAAAGEPRLAALALDAGLNIKRKKRTAARANSVAKLESSLIAAGANAEATVMLVLDEARLRNLALMRGERMLDVVGAGLLGHPSGVVSLPESLAKAVVTEQSNFRPANLKTWGTASNLIVLALQSHALKTSWEDISKKGGMGQVDAIASLLGSAAGMAGALTELGALLMTPHATVLPAAMELVSKVPVHLHLKYAAGMLMGAGAAFDAAVAVARSIDKNAQGDMDAGALYRNVAISQGFGSVSLGAGSYFAYRAAVLHRAGAAVATNILGASLSPWVLARCLTGFGLLLWLGGLGLSFYAMYLEDDVNEIYLRRSLFGTGHPQLGKYADLDQEMQAWAALSLGSMAEMEWNDETFGPDEITVIVKLFRPAPTSVVTVLVEGFDSIGGKKVIDIYKGKMPPLQRASKNDDGVVETSYKTDVTSGVNAIRLTYWLFASSKPGLAPIARGDLWIED